MLNVLLSSPSSAFAPLPFYVQKPRRHLTGELVEYRLPNERKQTASSPDDLFANYVVFTLCDTGGEMTKTRLQSTQKKPVMLK